MAVTLLLKKRVKRVLNTETYARLRVLSKEQSIKDLESLSLECKAAAAAQISNLKSQISVAGGDI